MVEDVKDSAKKSGADIEKHGDNIEEVQLAESTSWT